MVLELHPNASQNFNEKAEALLLELSPAPRQSLQGKASFVPDSHVTELEDAVFNGMTTSDAFGNVKAKYVTCGNQVMGLAGEAYQKVTQIANGIQKNKTFQRVISTELIIDLIFFWMRDRHQGTSTASMTEYVISEAEKKIEDIELWLPVAMTHIESEFQVGNITFKTFSRVMFDNWEAKRLEVIAAASPDSDTRKPSSGLEEFGKYIELKRQEWQGLAAATIQLRAEPERAEQIAFQEAEDALSILRFFSAANLVPQVISYCTLLGQENVAMRRIVIIKNGLFKTESVAPIDPIAEPRLITNEDIKQWKAGGLDALSYLLLMENKSTFQQTVLDNILLYSKSSLAKTLSEKLLYILSPLESLLLKNNTEPLQQNISERMAFLIKSDAKERLAVIQNFKSTYALRSSFVHHGQEVNPADVEVIQQFMVNAWICFTQMLRLSKRFSTKEDFINELENLKLSGGTI